MFDEVNLVIFLLLLDRQFYVDDRKSPGNHNDVQQSSVIDSDDVDLNTMVDHKSIPAKMQPTDHIFIDAV